MTFLSDAQATYVNGQPVSKGDVRSIWAAVDALQLALEGAIDQSGAFRLINLTGTADAFTAELAPGLENQTVSTGTLIRWVAIGTNTVEGPTIQIGSLVRQIRDTNNAPMPVGGIVLGRTYVAEIHSNGAVRLVTNGESRSDVAARMGAALKSSVLFLPTDVGASTDTDYVLTTATSAPIESGAVIAFVPHVTNGENATMTINGITRPMRGSFDASGGGGAALPAGRLSDTGQIYLFRIIGNNMGYVGVLPNNLPDQDPSIVAQRIVDLVEVGAPIPMLASGGESGEVIIAETVRDEFPLNRGGESTYTLAMPHDKPLGESKAITQGEFTRGISGMAGVSLHAGDRIVYRIDSNGAGTLLNVILTPQHLASMDEGIARAPQAVHQTTSSIPPRPDSAETVYWHAWDDPTARMRAKDLWFALPQPVIPTAPPLEMFYLRPTLGSGITDLVIRGVEIDQQIPELTSMQYTVDAGSPSTLPPSSPQAAADIADLAVGVESFVQLAYENMVGIGNYSSVKFYTPTGNTEFSHPMIARAPSTSDLAQGTYGFKNVIRVESNGNSHHMVFTETGAEPGPNRTGWLHSDVNGLNGDNIYCQTDVVNVNSVTTETFPAVWLGVNNPWPTNDPNDIEVAATPSGIFLVARAQTWELVNRQGGSNTVLESGALGSIPTSARLERVGSTLTAFVSGAQVVQHILADTSMLDENEGVMVAVTRPSGAGSARLRAANFIGGKSGV